ncbi:MAG: hypothetical protein WKG07_48645 [Hymenobacter sp.]
MDKTLLIIRDIPYGTTDHGADGEHREGVARPTKSRLRRWWTTPPPTVEIQVQLPPGISARPHHGRALRLHRLRNLASRPTPASSSTTSRASWAWRTCCA